MLGVKVDMLGIVGAHLSNMASGGPTVLQQFPVNARRATERVIVAHLTDQRPELRVDLWACSMLILTDASALVDMAAFRPMRCYARRALCATAIVSKPTR
jgi:hypothetical protein